jgi:hypothetical protein
MRFAPGGLAAAAGSGACVAAVVFAGAAPSVAAPADCTAEVSSTAQAAAQAAALPAGSTVCLAAGTYGTVTLSAARTGTVTVQPDPGAAVTLGDVDFPAGASHYHVDGFTVTGDVTLERGGASFITVTNTTMRGLAAYWGSHDLDVERDAIVGGGRTGEGIALVSIDCASPHAPTYSGCTTYPPVARVTIAGNRITGPFADDAINVSHYDGLDIEDNEITKVIENGEHNDSLQSTFGGSGLVFRRNYVHDICGQGFFLKDGRVTDVVLDDNLIVRDGGCDLAPSGELALDIFDTHGLQITRNTFVSAGLGEELQDYGSGPIESSGIVMNHNVLDDFSVAYQNPATYHGTPEFLEDHNVLARRGNWFTSGWAAATDSTAAAVFTDAARDDFRAAPVTAGGETYTAGVDWRPQDFTYGPGGAPAATPTASVTATASPTATSTATATATTAPTSTATPALGTVTAASPVGPATGRPRAVAGALLGNRTIEPRVVALPAGAARAYRSRAATGGRVAGLGVYLARPSARARIALGLYRDGGGRPGTRIAAATLTRPRTGWNAVALSARVAAGRSYWIAVLATRGHVGLRAAPGTSCGAWRARLGGALPVRWRAGAPASGCPASVYAARAAASSREARVFSRARDDPHDAGRGADRDGAVGDVVQHH